jgi:hypothetical protein
VIGRVLVMLALLPWVAMAQVRMDVRIEGVHTGQADGAEAAIGARVPLGAYLRAEVSVGGEFFKPSDPKLPSPRTEVAIRFLLDPINQHKRGLSIAGGLGYVDRAYLLVAADLEGQPMGGWRPALRFALGGGVRLGLVLRRSTKGRR